MNNLEVARAKIIQRDMFWGYFVGMSNWIPSDMEWVKDNEKKTLGVMINESGDINIYYNPAWAEEVKVIDAYLHVIHVFHHIIMLHTCRQYERDPVLWNLATDMAVNGKKSESYIYFSESKNATPIILEDGIYVPENWEISTAEVYYDKLKKLFGSQPKKKPNNQCNNSGKNQGDKNKGGGGKSNNNSGKNQGYQDGSGDQGDQDQDQDGDKGDEEQFKSKYGDNTDNHDTWNRSTAHKEQVKGMLSKRLEQVVQKMQGSIPGHLLDYLNKLAKPVVPWRQEFRNLMGRHLGGSRRTYSRPNRRNPIFGTKGKTHRNHSKGTVFVDSSGSIGKNELEQFFAEIERMIDFISFNIVIWDADLQGFIPDYKRGDWKKIKIRGGGGTDMAAPVKWAQDKKVLNEVGIMFTDGYCNWPAPIERNFYFCITTKDTPAPEWGKVVRLTNKNAE